MGHANYVDREFKFVPVEFWFIIVYILPFLILAVCADSFKMMISDLIVRDF